MEMENNETELIMLGTGNAAVTHCFNTCFLLRTLHTTLLVDGGGGNGILRQLEDAGINLNEIHDIFLTHAHTDHVLGVVWVIRMVAQRMVAGKYDGFLRVMGNDRAIRVLAGICRLTLPEKLTVLFDDRIELLEVEDREKFTVGDFEMQALDIRSSKEKQFGFVAELPDGQRLVCLGDEPCNKQCEPYVEGVEWLMCEAFCLYRDRDRFKPYEKHHSTALDAGRLAERLDVEHLLLYHTEDKTLSDRRRLYTEEAAQEFSGEIYVPDDLERMVL